MKDLDRRTHEAGIRYEKGLAAIADESRDVRLGDRNVFSNAERIRRANGERDGMTFIGSCLLSAGGKTRVYLYRDRDGKNHLFYPDYVGGWGNAMSRAMHRCRCEILAKIGDAGAQRELDYMNTHGPPFVPWFRPSMWKDEELARAARAENVRHGYGPEGRR